MAAAPPARTPAKPVSSKRSYLIWGALAICAVIATSASITLGIGVSRGTFSLAQLSAAPPPPQPVIQKPSGASEFEVARLRDAVRALSEQRDRLSTRIENLEQSMGDITASINTVKERVIAPPPPAAETVASTEPAAPEPDMPLPPSAPTVATTVETPPVAVTPPPADRHHARAADTKELETAEAPSRHRTLPKKDVHASHAAAPSRASRSHASKSHAHQRTARAGAAKTKPLQITPVTPPAQASGKDRHTQVAQILHPADITQSIALKTEFGVDLGGEISMDRLRALWASLKNDHDRILSRFRPIVRVREGIKPGTVELHLVAGPLSDAAAAARVCAELHHAKVACQTSEYDGQRLSLH